MADGGNRGIWNNGLPNNRPVYDRFLLASRKFRRALGAGRRRFFSVRGARTVGTLSAPAVVLRKTLNADSNKGRNADEDFG